MTEQTLDPTAVAAPAQSGDPVQGQLAAALEQRLSASMGGTAPQPVPTAAQPTVQTPVPTGVPPQDPVPVVSTAPVGDVSAMFLDRPPEQKPTAPQPQLPPEPPSDMPEGLSEKAQYTWQSLRADVKASRQAAEQYRQQIAEMERAAKAVADERVKFTDELKARDDRISRLEEDLGKLDLARKPEFQERYDKPMSAVVTQVEEVLRDATSLTDDAEIQSAADRVLDASDEDFNRIVSKLPAPVQGSLLDKRREFSRLTAARDHAISEWRSSADGVEALGEQQHVVERAQRRKAMADGAIEFLKVTTPFEQRPSVLSEPTYREDVENVDKSFRGFMQEAKDSDIARAAYQGFLMPVVQRQLAFAMEAMEQWRNAYYSMRGLAHPPAMPIRVQSERPPAPPAPPPLQLEPGQNAQTVLENTIEARLRQSGLMAR